MADNDELGGCGFATTRLLAGRSHFPRLFPFSPDPRSPLFLRSSARASLHVPLSRIEISIQSCARLSQSAGAGLDAILTRVCCCCCCCRSVLRLGASTFWTVEKSSKPSCEGRLTTFPGNDIDQSAKSIYYYCTYTSTRRADNENFWLLILIR